MRTERVNELKASMKSFGKEKYQKAELLDEMFALQQEIVSLTFNQDHAALAELRIWDVEKHLEQMNEELGNVADEELQRFIEGSKILCNLIIIMEVMAYDKRRNLLKKMTSGELDGFVGDDLTTSGGSSVW